MTKKEARQAARQHIADRLFMATFDNDQLVEKGERSEEDGRLVAYEIGKQAERTARFLGVADYPWGY